MAESRSSLRYTISHSRTAQAYLLDTGALIAVADPDDAHHRETLHCLKEIADHRFPLYISIPTIYETHRLILYRLGIARAREFLRSIFDGSTEIIWTESADEITAIAWIDQLSDQTITLTDAVNMALFAKLGMRAVFSFDKHFLMAGLPRVPPFL